MTFDQLRPIPPAVAVSLFLSLYPNRIKWILRPRGCKGWTTVSKHWPLSDETILSAVNGTEAGAIGARWGEKTAFAVLDIDARSKYHNVEELQKLTDNLAAVGLSRAVYRSSVSGGWHVYLFLDRWANSFEIEETLKRWLYSLGYEIRGGTLEIFPSGNGLRIPLQPGFGWLNDRGELVTAREELNQDGAISAFLADFAKHQNNWSEAKERIDTRLDAIDRAKKFGAQEQRDRLSADDFEPLYGYRRIEERYREGRRYWQTGLTAKGQRHDAILAVQHYLWHGDHSAGVPAMPAEHNDELRYRLILAWLEKNHNGYCNHINRGRWRKVEQQIRRSVKWRRRSGAPQVRTPYLMTERLIDRLIALYKSTGRVWSVEDLIKGNDGRQQKARERIRAAVQLMTEQGLRITRNELARRSGCSPNTVSRHRDLWHLLARGSGDKNPVLDLLGAGGCGAAVAIPSGAGAEKEKKENSDPLGSADSGDLGCVQGSCSGELAPIVLTPPFLLPGSKPSTEPPASRPSPAGAFGSLDAGALVQCSSGRTADDAGGLEPRTSGAVVIHAQGLFVNRETYRPKTKTERSGADTARRRLRTRGQCLYRAVRQDKGRTAYAPRRGRHEGFWALSSRVRRIIRHYQTRKALWILNFNALSRPPN